jgi:hypothetical protein
VTISGEVKHILNNTFLLVLIYEILIAIGQVIDYFTIKISSKKDNSSKAAFNAISKVLK